MSASYLILLAFLLGGVCGLRSMTAPALVCWAAYLGWLHLPPADTRIVGSPISVGIFTLFALAELVADKLPFIPSRVKPGPLIVRIVFAGLCARALCLTAAQPSLIAESAGALGAVAGAFAGYQLRRFLTVQKKLPDLPVALVEDAFAIGLGLFVVTRF
jgi:uncharacterized membrane protein